MSSLELIDKLNKEYTTLSKKEKKLETKNEVNPLSRMVQSYKRRKKDFRVIIEGEAGDGKSSLAQRFGEIHNPKTFIHNPKFAVDYQINFSANAWISAVVHLKKFSVNIYDEPIQSGGHHREFMSDANIIITKTMTGFRYRRFITPLCIPNLDMLDKDAIKLCQILINVYDQGKAEVFKIKRQKFGGDPWFQTMIDELTWDMPNPNLWALYEDKKERVQDDLYQQYSKRLSKKEREARPNIFFLNKIKEDKDSFMGRNERLSIPAIMAAFEVSRHRAEAIREMEERGFGQEK